MGMGMKHISAKEFKELIDTTPGPWVFSYTTIGGPWNVHDKDDPEYQYFGAASLDGLEPELCSTWDWNLLEDPECRYIVMDEKEVAYLEALGSAATILVAATGAGARELSRDEYILAGLAIYQSTADIYHLHKDAMEAK